MSKITPFSYGFEGQEGVKHDAIAKLLASFDLFYDPSFDDCDLAEIQEIAHETLALEVC